MDIGVTGQLEHGPAVWRNGKGEERKGNGKGHPLSGTGTESATQFL